MIVVGEGGGARFKGRCLWTVPPFHRLKDVIYVQRVSMREYGDGTHKRGGKGDCLYKQSMPHGRGNDMSW